MNDPRSVPTLLDALEGTGAIGSTVRQLAGQVGRPETAISVELESLRDRGRVSRMGRGLWVLARYRELSDRNDFATPEEYNERFEKEGGVALGAYRGAITFAQNDRLPVHRWWPYVQGYSADFVESLLHRFDLPRRATVLDPFSGSGTTLVEARRAGFRAVGTELMPPPALAARVKTRFELPPATLENEAKKLLARARRRAPGSPPFLRETHRHFAPSVLSDLTRLRDALPPSGTPSAEAARVAFGRILIPVSRLRRAPCLGYHRGEEGPAKDVFAEFGSAIAEMVDDLRSLSEIRQRWGPPATVIESDARTRSVPAGSVDLAVTSPPYVNGMDYVMNYKLDLAWLGYARSYDDLVALRRRLVACDNLPRDPELRDALPENSDDPWLREILSTIRRNVGRKGSYRRDDVHGIVQRYFADLDPVLQRVYEALRPGGRFVLVIGDSLIAGTYIPGDLLTARAGARIGFEIDSVEVARPRRSGQRRSFVLRESILTLRRPAN